MSPASHCWDSPETGWLPRCNAGFTNRKILTLPQAKQSPPPPPPPHASISCNAEEFHRAKPIYEEALRRRGFNGDMEYVDKQSEQRKIHKRDVTWFNPPFNQNVTTNVARQFLSLVDKHFPKFHRYHKLFNRNNVKCSYSCMNNMASIISSHNGKVLAPAPEQASRTCKCTHPQNCPINGHCLTECAVYKASVSAPNNPPATITNWLRDHSNPATIVTPGHYAVKAAGGKLNYQIRLDLQDQHLDYEVQWSIAQRAAPYKCDKRRCDVCLSEKMVIALADPSTLWTNGRRLYPPAATGLNSVMTSHPMP